MKFLKIIIILNLLGLLVFNLQGLLTNAWFAGYFFWEKSVGAGFLVWLSIYYSLKISDKWLVRPMLIISVLRFSWQVVAYGFGWGFNDALWLALFFIVLSVAAGYLVLYENSRYNVWLSKHLNL